MIADTWHKDIDPGEMVDSESREALRASLVQVLFANDDLRRELAEMRMRAELAEAEAARWIARLRKLEAVIDSVRMVVK